MHFSKELVTTHPTNFAPGPKQTIYPKLREKNILPRLWQSKATGLDNASDKDLDQRKQNHLIHCEWWMSEAKSKGTVASKMK